MILGGSVLSSAHAQFVIFTFYSLIMRGNFKHRNPIQIWLRLCADLSERLYENADLTVAASCFYTEEPIDFNEGEQYILFWWEVWKFNFLLLEIKNDLFRNSRKNIHICYVT
jgi:hypothetical protein